MSLVVKIFLEPGAKMPQRGKPGDAGLDVFAHLPNGPVTVKQGDLVKIPLGFRYGFALRADYAVPPMDGFPGVEAGDENVIDHLWFDVRNRSGVGTKSGMATVAEVGDGNYRGILHYCAAKITAGEFVINDGDKIAQIMLVPFMDPRGYEIEQVESIEALGDTQRGETGFGDSGK